MKHHPISAPRGSRPLGQQRAADLLARYPHVSGNEAREILSFLRDGRYLDVGIVTSNRRLQPKLDEFLKDHWIHFHVKPGQSEAAVSFTVVLLILASWAIWAAW